MVRCLGYIDEILLNYKESMEKEQQMAELRALEEAILRLPHDKYPDAGNIVKNVLYLGLPTRMTEGEGKEAGV